MQRAEVAPARSTLRADVAAGIVTAAPRRAQTRSLAADASMPRAVSTTIRGRSRCRRPCEPQRGIAAQPSAGAPALHGAIIGRGTAGVDDGPGRHVEAASRSVTVPRPPDGAVFARHPQPLDRRSAGGARGRKSRKPKAAVTWRRHRKLVGEVLQRCAADAPADEQRVGQPRNGNAVPSGPASSTPVADIEAGERARCRRRVPRPGSDAIAAGAEEREWPA